MLRRDHARLRPSPPLHTVKIDSIEELQAYFTYDPARDVIVSGTAAA